MPSVTLPTRHDSVNVAWRTLEISRRHACKEPYRRAKISVTHRPSLDLSIHCVIVWYDVIHVKQRSEVNHGCGLF